MKILLHTAFHPSVGGIETVAWLLAHEWTKLNQKVAVSTNVECRTTRSGDFPFQVHYRPTSTLLWQLVREADVSIHFNASIRACWPLPFLRRPVIMSHHTFYFSN